MMHFFHGLLILILRQIMTFPDPPCQLGQIFMVPNGLNRDVPQIVLHIQLAPIGGILGPLKPVLELFQLLNGEVVFVVTAIRILEILLSALSYFFECFV